MATRKTIATGISVLVLLTFLAACSGRSDRYPEQGLSLAWKTTIPVGGAILLPKDTGAADVEPFASSQGRPPMIYLDVGGLKTGELVWSEIPQHNRAQDVNTEFETKLGWIAVDYNFDYYSIVVTTESSTVTSTGMVKLDSMIKMVDRDGGIVWETPGLASAEILHIDDSIVVCSGKDPAVVDEISREGLSGFEWGTRVQQAYDQSLTAILILDAATGQPVNKFDIPENLRAIDVVDFGDKKAILAAESDDAGTPSMLRMVLYGTSDGSVLLSLDIRDALPGISASYAFPYSAGIAVSRNDGLVSLLDLDGKELWTKTPKGSSVSAASVPGFTVSSSDGLLLTEYFRSYSSDGMAITVFDKNGDSLAYEDGFHIIKSASGTSRVIAMADSSTIGESSLLVFDLRDGKVVVSQARVPTPDGLAVSPSGEFVLTLQKVSDTEATVSMYRLEGIED